MSNLNTKKLITKCQQELMDLTENLWSSNAGISCGEIRVNEALYSDDFSLSCPIVAEGAFASETIMQKATQLVEHWKKYASIESVNLTNKDNKLRFEIKVKTAPAEIEESYTQLSDEEIPHRIPLPDIDEKDYTCTYTVSYLDSSTGKGISNEFDNYNEAYRFFDESVHNKSLTKNIMSISATDELGVIDIHHVLYEAEDIAPIDTEVRYQVHYTDTSDKEAEKNHGHYDYYDEEYYSEDAAEAFANKLMDDFNCRSLEINKITTDDTMREYTETIKAWALDNNGNWVEYNPETGYPKNTEDLKPEGEGQQLNELEGEDTDEGYSRAKGKHGFEEDVEKKINQIYNSYKHYVSEPKYIDGKAEDYIGYTFNFDKHNFNEKAFLQAKQELIQLKCNLEHNYSDKVESVDVIDDAHTGQIQIEINTLPDSGMWLTDEFGNKII